MTAEQFEARILEAGAVEPEQRRIWMCGFLTALTAIAGKSQLMFCAGGPTRAVSMEYVPDLVAAAQEASK